MNTPPTPLNYTDNSTLWENVHSSRTWGRYPPEELVRFVARTYFSVPDRSKVHFLEMGCGQGANLWFLIREGFSVAGIDFSPSAIAKTKERLSAEGLSADMPTVDVRVGDFSALPWPSDSFDVVLDIESIYANEMVVIKACIAEAYRVLVPGGRMFCKMFGNRTSGYATGTDSETGTTRNPEIGACAGFGVSHFFTEDEIRELFSGFAQIHLDWSNRSDRDGAIEVFEWVVQAQK